jgi:hypothetical protein
MSIARSLKLLTAIAIIALVASVLLVAGCNGAKPQPIKDSTPAPGASPAPSDNAPVAKVGDVEITYGDLLYTVDVIVYMKQKLINSSIFEQEAKKRGVYPTQDAIEAAYKKDMDAQGGEDKLLKGIPPTLADIPKELFLKYFRNQSIQQFLQKAILEDEFKKQHGDFKQEELDQVWTQETETLRNSIANEKGIKPEQVTEDMATAKLQESVKQKWMGQNAQKALESIMKSYTVDNYLLDQYLAAHPAAKEEAQVPAIQKSDSQSEPLGLPIGPGAKPNPGGGK